jgi:hypothetical protein
LLFGLFLKDRIKTPAQPAFSESHVVSVSDVQSTIHQVLGVLPAANDLNEDGMVNVLDVQIEINAAPALGCSTG